MNDTKRAALNDYSKPWTPVRRLTRQQFKVVALLFHEGCDYPMIADRLSISVRTVKQHVERVADWLPGNGFPAWKVLRFAERLLERGFEEAA